jgi:hypothetical protein
MSALAFIAILAAALLAVWVAIPRPPRNARGALTLRGAIRRDLKETTEPLKALLVTLSGAYLAMFVVAFFLWVLTVVVMHAL